MPEHTINKNIYAIFHLNLAFSSIDKSEHQKVVENCYWPLLESIINKGIPIGMELTAYTLECIQEIDPNWVIKLKSLLKDGLCDLIASGYTQIIGPLIPAKANQANLRLGQAAYQKLLEITPRIAYLNEQTVSAGLLDIYIDAGFEAVVVEWDNPYSHNPDWQLKMLKRPQSLRSASGRRIKVIWNHAIAFQKFQRYVHGELTLADYGHYLEQAIQPGTLAFPVYGSDAEVFDFRPGRYHTEEIQISGEWERIALLFNTLDTNNKYKWIKPSELLSLWHQDSPLNITNAEHPVSVKKQAKYNICRWGLSGRNDLLLNTICHKRLKDLDSRISNDEDWRNLCRLWASDLRTHLTLTRYEALDLMSQENIEPSFTIWKHKAEISIQYDEERRRLHIKTQELALTLNGNRGLAIDSLAFSKHDFVPIIGTLPQGCFEHINHSADYYSNHLLIERFRDRDRVTDLNRVNYQLAEQDGCLFIYCRQSLKSGSLLKWYRLDGDSLHTGFHFEDSCRPEASIRLGFINLLNCESRAWYQTHLGGVEAESFQLCADIDQGAPISSIVSSSSALGATEGSIHFGNKNSGVRISWDPASCAALPMISSKQIDTQYLNRLWFSLAEADETLKPDGNLLDFEICITPERNHHCD
ncbi:glycoside hydrolase [Shewanella electrodiphila]|uniref:Glycoside hydrolase n=1 Tax=Shewanella electrodiphila TaxID=934143 RepID=A0ABT0KLS1_9GAMM|nr:glycoside hydrolase [Shewanella electrodiphila]MCL1044787.1 glycoside hydrolase [Shewanella electrodiphila]